MSHPWPAVKDPEQTKMKKAPNQPVSNQNALHLPSTSKVSMKNEESRPKPIITNLPQMIPILSKDGTTKLIQISSLTNLPKQYSSKRKVASTLPKLDHCPKFQSSDQTQTSNVKIVKPIQNSSMTSCKIDAPIVEFLPKNNPCKEVNSTALPVSNTSSSSAINKASHTLLSKTSIPSILQKKVLLLSASNNISDINKQDIKTAQSISDIEKIYNKKINNELASPVSQESNTSNEKQTSESTPRRAKKRGKCSKMVKSPRRKEKRIKDANKDNIKVPLNEEFMYVADGFNEDIENLLEKCLQVYKLNFEKFTDIWKEMDFPCIFYGRQSNAELAELSEEVIHVAKAHMLAKNVSFEQNVAGLFLVYALLNHQPFSGFASLRLIPGDVPSILSLETEARRQKRHDVLYVLGNVLIKGPCQYHVLAREVSLEAPIRKYHDGSVHMTSSLDSVFTRNAECVQHFKKLTSLEQRYQAMRQKLRERHAGKDKISNLCKRPAASLYDLFRAHLPTARLRHRNTEQIINEMSTTWKPKEDRSDLLKSIKDRAMGNAVDPMKHLTGVYQMQQDSTSSSSEESEVESRPTGRKLRGKRKGRSSAIMLEELFRSDIPTEEVFVPEPSQKPMPILDDIEELTAKNQTDKSLPKKGRTSLDNDDSKNNNQSKRPKKRKLKNDIDSPSAKRKAPSRNKKSVIDLSDPNLDLITIDDLLPVEDRIEDNLGIRNEDEDDIINEKEAKSKKVNEKSNKCLESLIQQTNSEMPSIIIEIEGVNEDVEIFDDCKETFKSPKKERKTEEVPKSEGAAFSKDVSNNNTATIKFDTKDKRLKRAKIKKDDLKKTPDNQDTNKDVSKCLAKKKHSIFDANISEDTSSPGKTRKRRKKPVKDANNSPKTMSSPEVINSPMTPRTRRESQRIKDLTKSPTTGETRTSPMKGQNTVCEGDSDSEKYQVHRGLTKRLKSSFKRLGLLEVANDSEALKKVEKSSLKSGLRNK